MSVDITKLRNQIQETKAADILVFKPTRDQRQAKANFWTYFLSGDVSMTPIVTLTSALKYGADSRISQWWEDPGFVQWFSNQDEFRQRLEFLANTSLDHLEALLFDEKANASAKVQAIKLIMEISRKMPTRSEEGPAIDEKIRGMNKKELEQFISSRISLIAPSEEVNNDEYNTK